MLDLSTRISGLGGNRRIADALLAVLGEDGDSVMRARVMRALGESTSALERSGDWIPEDRLRSMLEVAGFDRRRARRIGQVLVRPSALSLAVCYSGIATPSKVYRRVQHLLARESPSAHYETVSVAIGSARIRFHPCAESGGASGDARSFRGWPECGEALCGMRQGMLAGLPLLFGLTPAHVMETRCVYAGDPHCEFEAQWTDQSRRGLVAGAVAGALAGTLFVSVGWWSWPGLLGGLLLGGAMGRGVDLSRQLEAVAGVRRGQLALLEQMDAGLSERMDALAQLEGVAPESEAPAMMSQVASGEGLIPAGSRCDSVRVSAGETAGFIRQRASEIYEAASALREELASLQLLGRDSSLAELRHRLQSGERHGRRIGETAVEIDRALGGGVMRKKTDLRSLVERAATALESEWPDELSVELDLAGAQPPVNCDPLQIEIVVEQLLRNAAAANGHRGTVILSLRSHQAGVEVTVADQGDGIEADLLDQVFDPFVLDEDDAPSSGLGLTVCFRIVEEHGGELRIQTGDEGGTRVAFVLSVD